MPIKHIITLLEFCLKNTYFLFQCKYSEHAHGAAVGSLISPIVASIFMEEFETKAINSVTHPLMLWFRYMDDTFVIKKAQHSIQFLQHINSIDPNIQFIRLQTQMVPFLFWTLVSP